MPNEYQSIGFILLVLVSIAAVPLMINATEDTQEPLELTTEEAQTVNHNLNVRLDSTNDTAETATVTVSDSETLESDTETIQLNQTVDYSFNRGTVSMTVTDVSVDSAMLTAGYPATYGWGDGATLIADNFALIIVSFVVVIIMAIGFKSV